MFPFYLCSTLEIQKISIDIANKQVSPHVYLHHPQVQLYFLYVVFVLSDNVIKKMRCPDSWLIKTGEMASFPSINLSVKRKRQLDGVFMKA